MTLTFRPGRLPAEPARPHLAAATFLTAQPAPPASSDWLSPVPGANWGMLGNDQWGDCTCAGVAHKRIGDIYLNQHQTLTVTTADTLAFYSAITGFDPTAGPSGSNPTDQGAVCQDVLDYWRKNGFLGEKILAFAKVNLSNQTQVKQAIATLGQIYCGFNFPSTAMDQFNAGQSWEVVRGARIEGGHCVTIGAYDATGLECVTWGKVQRMSWAFFAKYFDEAWVIVTPDFVDSASGDDVLGLSLYQLGQEFALLTGLPNPIPAPQPTPTPVPPQPAPAGPTGPQVAAAVRQALTTLGV